MIDSQMFMSQSGEVRVQILRICEFDVPSAYDVICTGLMNGQTRLDDTGGTCLYLQVSVDH